MAYKALYRKYRPETFETVVGQKHIVKTLQNAIEKNKVAHAYIFSGPRGTGKTTMAKLLAKALNCTCDGAKPCNVCSNCVAINEGSHPDVIEIDAASNNGVDEVRDLIEKVKYAPILGKYKVYIIDEVHMMTPGAFNSLLKTLEEPPEHVVFILATTDVHKVLPTVLSRCQRFDFSKIEYDDIKNRIEEILNIENISYEPEVTSLVAELADGGMRDALSILDQVVSYAGDNITLQHIYDIYGMMSTQDMVNYLTLLANGKTKDVLNLIETYIGKGIDVKRLTYDLMVILKDAIVYKSTKDASILERLNEKGAKEILDNYSIDTALQVSDILNEARNNYRLSTNYRLFFEIASLKAIEAISTNKESFKEIDKPLEKEVEKVEKKEETIVKPQVVEKKVEKKEEPVLFKSSFVYNAPQESEIITYTMDEYINILCHGDRRFKEDLSLKWQDIRNYINDPNTRYVAQLLVDAKIMAASQEYVLLGYDYKLLSSRARQKNNILLIKEFLKDIFGFVLEVYVIETSYFIDIKQKFFELRQANKLPALSPLPKLESNIVLENIKKDENKDEDKTVELGKSLFGDDLEIE